LRWNPGRRSLFGWWVSASRNITELYDGAIWGFGGNLNAARHAHACLGSQGAALAGVGLSGATYLYSGEKFNGVSWAINAAHVARIANTAGAGTSTSGIRAGEPATLAGLALKPGPKNTTKFTKVFPGQPEPTF